MRAEAEQAGLNCMICHRACGDSHAAFECAAGHIAEAIEDLRAGLTCDTCHRACADGNDLLQCALGHLAAATDMARELGALIHAVEDREVGGEGG
jgi:hypothetical protein